MTSPGAKIRQKWKSPWVGARPQRTGVRRRNGKHPIMALMRIQMCG